MICKLTEEINNCYKAAIKDVRFKTELCASDPSNYVEPNDLSPEGLKVIFGCIYYGWLVGRGGYIKGMFN